MAVVRKSRIANLFLFCFCLKQLIASCLHDQESSATCIIVDELPVGENGDLNLRAMPSIGNGYIGTVVFSDEIHVSGVFNGRANVEPDYKKNIEDRENEKGDTTIKIIRERTTNRSEENRSKSVNHKKDNRLVDKDGRSEPANRKKDNQNKKGKNSSEERKSSSNGYYNHTHRARIPSTVAINFSLPFEGERSFGLDMQQGVFYQWCILRQISIEQRVYAHRDMKNIVVNEIIVKADIDVTLVLTSLRGLNTKDIIFHNTTNEYVNRIELPYKVIFGEINETETEDSEKVSIAVVWTKVPKALNIKASDKSQKYSFVTAIATSLESDNPVDLALECYRNATDIVDLFSAHSRSWRKIFENGNITVHNNLYVAQTIYASFYAIYSSIRDDWEYGLSPGSLSVSYEYLGHTFWDQDIWMFPSILMFVPNIAKSLIYYRYARLQAAIEIAKKNKYQGAMYPWESALSGFEVCPQEVYGRNEIHVTGDIAFAVNQYYVATQDLDWMKEYGFDIIYQTALFWSSRVEYNETKDAYIINDVMPPDEYHYPVNNSVYTNTIAQLNIRLAIKFGALLGEKIPDSWQEIADKMFIPYDSTLKYHPEYEGFNISDSKSVKQADTILIYYPLMTDTVDEEVKRNDLLYYGDITDVDGPAMTNSMFTIGWLDIGKAESAYESFQKTFDNIQEPFKVWSEIKGGQGAANFITAAGGYLQAIIFGYGGMRLKDDELYFDLNLIDTMVEEIFWNGIKFRGNTIQFHRKGSECDVSFLKEKSSYISQELCVEYILTTKKTLKTYCSGVIKQC